jgi:hypothetical protein
MQRGLWQPPAQEHVCQTVTDIVIDNLRGVQYIQLILAEKILFSLEYFPGGLAKNFLIFG